MKSWERLVNWRVRSISFANFFNFYFKPWAWSLLQSVDWDVEDWVSNVLLCRAVSLSAIWLFVDLVLLQFLSPHLLYFLAFLVVESLRSSSCFVSVTVLWLFDTAQPPFFYLDWIVLVPALWSLMPIVLLNPLLSKLWLILVLNYWFSRSVLARWRGKRFFVHVYYLVDCHRRAIKLIMPFLFCKLSKPLTWNSVPLIRQFFSRGLCVIDWYKLWPQRLVAAIAFFHFIFCKVRF